MIDWSYLVCGLAVLLLLFLLWKEIGRENKARLAWRVSTTFLAVVSLACIGLSIMYTRTVTTDPSNNAILLTEGFNPDSVSRFLQVNGKNMPVVTLDEKLVSAGKYNTTLLTGIDSNQAFGALHVFGYGLGKEDTMRLQKQPVVFHPSTLNKNINSVYWPSVITSGERLSVQGSFTNLHTTAKKLVLTNFHTTLDSAIIPANTQQDFQLATVPKQLGRSLYTLAVIENKDTLQKEPVPVQVEEGVPVKVLILAASPDFENRFVKNWLSQKGYEVVVRSTISKNKFEKEFLNTSAFPVEHLTNALLDKFTVVIADATELAALNKEELELLRSHIAQKGLGLITKADSAVAHPSFYLSGFPFIQVHGEQQQTLNLRLVGSESPLKTLIAPSPIFIQVQEGTWPLVTDREKGVLVSSRLYGSGKIVLTTLSNTFSWVLSGNQADYDALWSELINHAGAVRVREEYWHTSPELPRIDQLVIVSLQTNQTGLPQAQVAGTTVSLANDPYLPFQWKGIFWPSKPGWQTGIQLNGQVYYWYVYGEHDWQTVSAASKIVTTKTFARLHSVEKKAGIPIAIEEQVPFPKIIFFLIFLACCGYLWFENKYYNS